MVLEGKAGHGDGHAADRVSGGGRWLDGDGGLSGDHGLRRRVRNERAGGTELDELGQDGDGDLLVRGVPEVEPDRRMHPVESLAGDAPIGQVAEHGFAPPPRGDQPDEQRFAGHGLLHGVLVAMTLGGHDDGRAAVDIGAREVGPVDHVRPPVEVAGELR